MRQENCAIVIVGLSRNIARTRCSAPQKSDGRYFGRLTPRTRSADATCCAKFGRGRAGRAGTIQPRFSLWRALVLCGENSDQPAIGVHHCGQSLQTGRVPLSRGGRDHHVETGTVGAGVIVGHVQPDGVKAPASGRDNRPSQIGSRPTVRQLHPLPVIRYQTEGGCRCRHLSAPAAQATSRGVGGHSSPRAVR